MSEPAKKPASARGLFRATGKKPRPVRDLIDGEIVEMEHRERSEDDFDPTPPEPTHALLAAEGHRLRDFGAIWEPAAGDGRMVRELVHSGLPVYQSDLIDRGCGAVIRDFFDFTEPMAPAIVTNPPFCEVNWRDGRGRWLTHAMETLRVPYMALLLNWSWPGAAGLGPLYERHKPATAYLMRWKIDFTGQGAPPMLNGWFVWDPERLDAQKGETVLKMLDRVDVRQGNLLLSPEGTAGEAGGTAALFGATSAAVPSAEEVE